LNHGTPGDRLKYCDTLEWKAHTCLNGGTSVVCGGNPDLWLLEKKRDDCRVHADGRSTCKLHTDSAQRTHVLSLHRSPDRLTAPQHFTLDQQYAL